MTDTHSGNPKITIVVSTAFSAAAARLTLASVAMQTIRNDIELLFVVNPGTDVSAVQLLLNAVGSARVIDDAPIDTVDKSSARAAMSARAPFVSLIEDHAFPDPDWAERVVEAFETSGADGVGTAVQNANPSTWLSWSNFILAYSHWSEITPRGEIGWISHHNGSLRTAALHRLGEERVVAGSNREGDIIRDIKKGGMLYFEPRARIRHINPSNLNSTFKHRWDVGRLYATNRARQENWSVAKRLTYVVLGPAIPFLRYVRMRRDAFVQLPEINERTHGIAMLIGLVFDAAGQMVGYLAGEGKARQRMEVFEMDRAKHLVPNDRKEFYPEGI